jgi:hypothetical protein
MRRAAKTSLTAIFAAIACMATFASCASAGAQQFEMSEDQFNQWLTNSQLTAADLLKSEVAGRLARLDRTCKLSDAQRHKIELAAQGDIARFQSSLAPLHDELVGKKFDQQVMGDIFQKIQPYQQRFQRGVLDSSSLFQKVMVSTLDADQRQAYDRDVTEQVRFQYRASLKLFVASLDEAAPMLDEQRAALIALLMKSTRPPRRWDKQYGWTYVLNQAATCFNEVSHILDKAQLRCFNNMVRQANGMATNLIGAGMAPSEEPLAPEEDFDGDKSADHHEVAEPKQGN